jgi:hypothetical protein
MYEGWGMGKIDKLKLVVHPRFRNSKLFKVLLRYLSDEVEDGEERESASTDEDGQS